MTKGLIVATVLGCSLPLCVCAKIVEGGADYTPPIAVLNVQNAREFPAAFDATWRELVSYLSETSFVIDNIDKSSGLVSISFSASDPESAIDCGQWSTWAKNLRGRRDYSYSGAASFAQYELVDNGRLFSFERKVTLTGKINIFATSVGADATRVKVTVRYVPTIALKASAFALDSNFNRLPPQTKNESFSFNTSQEAQVPGGQTLCRAKGTVEGDLLGGIGERLASASGGASTANEAKAFKP